MKRIIITVSPSGETTVETKGYHGPACKEASRPYEEALGLKTAEKHTAEYHQQNPTTNRQQIGGK